MTKLPIWNRLIPNRWSKTHWGEQYLYAYFWARDHEDTRKEQKRWPQAERIACYSLHTYLGVYAKLGKIDPPYEVDDPPYQTPQSERRALLVLDDIYMGIRQ